MILSAEAIIAIVGLFVTLCPVIAVFLKLCVNKQRRQQVIPTPSSQWPRNIDIELQGPVHRDSRHSQMSLPVHSMLTTQQDSSHGVPLCPQAPEMHISDRTVYPSTRARHHHNDIPEMMATFTAIDTKTVHRRHRPSAPPLPIHSQHHDAPMQHNTHPWPLKPSSNTLLSPTHGPT